MGSVQGLLGQARSLLRSCAQTVDAFQAAGQDNSSYRQDLSDLVANINQNRPDSQELLDTVAQLNRQVHAALDKAQAALDKAFDAAEKILNGIGVDAQLPQIQEDLRDAAQTMDDMGDKLTAWARSIAVEAGPWGPGRSRRPAPGGQLLSAAGPAEHRGRRHPAELRHFAGHHRFGGPAGEADGHPADAGVRRCDG